jgi:peptidoglycan-associated lipoprotein
MKRFTYGILISALAASALVGCATNRTVEERIAQAQAQTGQRIDSVQNQVEDLQQRQQATEQRLDEVSKEAREALQRAQEAGVLARGQVVFEQSFTEDRVRFRTGSANLTSDAEAALNEFAQRIKDLDRPVYIEIQGHTDNTGGEAMNMRLGERRAEAVRRYLNQRQGLPLVRMSTISYGETSPVAANSNRDGRAQNRRVVLVVLE